MITKIIAENFMGAVGRKITDVAKFTAFAGRNGSGKSTILRSAIVTTQGYVSEEHGKQAVKTMELARADEMITGIELDSGARYERIFRRSGKGASAVTRLDGKEIAYREGDGIIKNDLGDFPVMFNLKEFEKLSPDLKKKFLFSISGAIKDIDDKDKFLATLRYELMKQVIDNVTPDNLLEFKMAVQSFDDLPKNEYGEYFGTLDGQLDPDVVEYIDMLMDEFSDLFTPSPQVLFDTLLKTTSEEESAQRRAVRDTDATRTKLAEVASDLDGKKQELETVERELAACNMSKEKTISKISGNEANILRVQDHERMISKLMEKIEDDEKFLAENADLTTLIESIEKLGKDVASAGAIRADRKSSLAVLSEDYDKKIALMNEHRALKSKATTLKESLQSVKGTCLVSSLIPCNENFSGPIADAEKEISLADKNIGPLKAETEELRTEMQKIQNAMDAETVLAADAERVLAQHKTDLAVIESRRTTIIKTLDSTKAELADVQARKMPNVFDGDILEGELLATRNKIVLLEDRKTAINRAEATFNALNDQILKARTSSEKLAVAQGLKKTVQTMRNQLLDAAVKPLVESVTGLMQQMDPTFSVIFDMDNGFSIKVFKDGQWQYFSSLCGGEYVIFMAGLLTAIIVTANPAMKVLILEAAELDLQNIKLVMEALPIVAAELDNVLLAYPREDIEDVDGWLIHRLVG